MFTKQEEFEVNFIKFQVLYSSDLNFVQLAFQGFLFFSRKRTVKQSIIATECGLFDYPKSMETTNSLSSLGCTPSIDYLFFVDSSYHLLSIAYL